MDKSWEIPADLNFVPNSCRCKGWLPVRGLFDLLEESEVAAVFCQQRCDPGSCCGFVLRSSYRGDCMCGHAFNAMLTAGLVLVHWCCLHHIASCSGTTGGGST
eukprot:symbB.v1.2.029229.t1/scaffold3079.1/size64120/2